MDRSINATQLRASLPQIVRRVNKGESFLVLYRSRPAFRVVPVDPGKFQDELLLTEDPIYRAEAVGRSTDGLKSSDNDKILYGKREGALRRYGGLDDARGPGGSRARIGKTRT